MDTDQPTYAETDIPVNYRLFLSPLDAMESEALWDAAKNVEALVQHPGWEFIQDLVERVERRTLDQVVRDSTTRSRTPDAAEYAATMGLIRGLRVVRDAADTVLLKARVRDEEERENARQLAETGQREE